jgi:hypothetical protein
MVEKVIVINFEHRGSEIYSEREREREKKHTRD